MAIIDLFSKRQKRIRGELPDVYSYDEIPDFLRVQIIQIWKDALGGNREYQLQSEVADAYDFIDKALCREYGVFRLPGTNKHENKNSCVEVANFFLQ